MEPFLADTNFEIGKLHYLPEAFENHRDRQKVFNALKTMSYREFKTFALTNSMLQTLDSLPRIIEASLYEIFYEKLESNEEARALLEKAYEQDKDVSTYHLNDSILDSQEYLQ